MASILNVDQINNAAGTSAVTIDASTGKPSFPNGATLPAGSVVKETLVDVTPSSPFVTTSSTYSQAFAGSFTPQLSTSTIIADISFYQRSYRANGADGRMKFRVLVDGSEEFALVAHGAYDYGGSGAWLKVNSHAAIQINNTTGNSVSVSVDTATSGASTSTVYPSSTDEGRATIRFTEIAQ
jgi:hypothetical protein